MADITKSVSNDFDLGLDLSQFNDELQALTLTVTVDNLRVDGDTLTITLSGTPSGADDTAIDGAVDTHDPSVVTQEEQAQAQAEVFGTAAAYIEQESVSVRVDDAWREVNCLQVPEIQEGGVYRIAWFYEWSADVTNKDFELRVHLNNNTIMSSHRQEPKESGGSSISGSGTDQRHIASGFRHVSLSQGDTPFIDIDIRGQDDNYEVTVYRSRIEFWRIS